MQLRYFHDRSQSDSGSCTYRKVQQKGAVWLVDVHCDEGDANFKTTERITVDGDRMTLSRKLPWSKDIPTVTLMRCDR